MFNMRRHGRIVVSEALPQSHVKRASGDDQRCFHELSLAKTHIRHSLTSSVSNIMPRHSGPGSFCAA